MRRSAIISAVFLALVGTACTGDASKVDSNLNCAAMISAASHLAARGELEIAPDFNAKALISGMTHLNSYAIPAGLSESDAFDHLNARRDVLIETRSPSKILGQAKSCLRKTPKQ